MQNLDFAMLMYNLLEYSKSYRKTKWILWNYYRDEPYVFPANNYNANLIKNSESFEYKTSITQKTLNANQGNGENTDQEKTKTKKIFKSLFH